MASHRDMLSGDGSVTVRNDFGGQLLSCILAMLGPFMLRLSRGRLPRTCLEGIRVAPRSGLRSSICWKLHSRAQKTWVPHSKRLSVCL